MKKPIHFLLSMLCVFFLNGFNAAQGAAHVNLYTDHCVAGTDYIEFQMNITNSSTAGETLYINTPGTWRITHSAAILPTGTNSFLPTYVAGSCDTLLAPLFTTPGTSYNLSYNPTTRLLQCGFSNAILGNQVSMLNAPVLPGQSISAGRFRLTITNGTYINNTPVGLAWSGTTSGLVAYVDANSASTAFNTSGNRTLDTMCTMSIPVNTGMAEASNEFVLRSYPNPVVSSLFVSAANSIGTVVVQDVTGKKFLEVTIPGNEGTIDVSTLSPGMYFLIREASAVRTRIVVQ